MKAAPFACSLSPSAFPVNACPSRTGAQLFVAGAGFAWRASAAGEREHPQDANAAAQRNRDHAADADQLAGFFDPLAIDAHMAGLDQCLRQGPAFDQADAVQIAVDPHL